MSEEYRILDVDWLHNIWRPDCFFKNAKKVTFHEMSIPNHYLWLYHDKTLLYMSKWVESFIHPREKFESFTTKSWQSRACLESLHVGKWSEWNSRGQVFEEFLLFIYIFFFAWEELMLEDAKILFICLFLFRLTLVLSCAMKFESYPHDTQICSMMIESRT